MGWAQLFEHAGRQHDVVTRGCAAAAGVPPSTLAARARRERWPEPVPNAWILPGRSVTTARRAVAVGLLVGDRGLLTGWTALGLLGVVRPMPTTIEVLLLPRARMRPLPRVRFHQTRLVQPPARRVHGVPVTDAAHSLARLCGRVTLPALRAIALDAGTRGLLTNGDLDRELAARANFPGRADLRQLRDDLTGDGSESGFEFDVRGRLICLGLAPHPEQAIVAVGGTTRRIDIPYLPEQVGIECLGFAWHSSPQDLERDTVRANQIAVLDEWLVLRLTFAMFHQRFEPFVAQLREALGRRRSAPRSG